MATLNRLWHTFSGGKYSYSAQKKIWALQKKDYDMFCKKVGWTITDEGSERKRNWFGTSEFIYDGKAPAGHLPLTSALRGTALLKRLMAHPVLDNEDWMKEPE